MSYQYTQRYDEVNYTEILEINITNNLFDKNLKKNLNKVKKNFSYPGFRKGHVPNNIILSIRYNEIHNQALIDSVNEFLQKIIDQITPQPIGPFIINSYSKEVMNYKVTVSYIPMPQVDLPDFSSITITRVKPKEPSEEEIFNEMKNIWYVHSLKVNPNVRKEDFNIDLLTPDLISSLKIYYPDQTQVSNLDDFKNFVKTSLEESYNKLADIENEKLMIEEVLKQTKYQKLEGILNQELTIRKEKYLSSLDKSDSDIQHTTDLEAKWRAEIERQIKLDLLIRTYSIKYNITISNDELFEETLILDDNLLLNDENNNLRNMLYWQKLKKKVFEDMSNKVKYLEN